MQEFNDFDLERLLKGVIDTLEEDNAEREKLLSSPPLQIDDDTRTEFSNAIKDNAAEMIRVSSVLTHTDDIYSYFEGGPLFRKDRDVK